MAALPGRRGYGRVSGAGPRRTAPRPRCERRPPATRPSSHSGGLSSTLEATQPRMARMRKPGPWKRQEQRRGGDQWAGSPAGRRHGRHAAWLGRQTSWAQAGGAVPPNPDAHSNRCPPRKASSPALPCKRSAHLEQNARQQAAGEALLQHADGKAHLCGRGACAAGRGGGQGPRHRLPMHDMQAREHAGRRYERCRCRARGQWTHSRQAQGRPCVCDWPDQHPPGMHCPSMSSSVNTR